MGGEFAVEAEGMTTGASACSAVFRGHWIPDDDIAAVIGAIADIGALLHKALLHQIQILLVHLWGEDTMKKGIRYGILATQSHTGDRVFSIVDLDLKMTCPALIAECMSTCISLGELSGVVETNSTFDLLCSTFSLLDLRRGVLGPERRRGSGMQTDLLKHPSAIIEEPFDCRVDIPSTKIEHPPS